MFHLDFDQLVQPDRVSRRLYTDGDIYTAEMARIFGQSWLYVGHESQVPNSGDYAAARLSDKPIIMVRQKGGEIKLIHNRCMHKGMQLVGDESAGHVSAFRCGYHGWVYGLGGELRTVPADAGYACSAVKKGAEEFALRPIDDVALYRGFIFARLASGGPDFETWLGPMKSSLDNFVDRSPEGQVKVEGGVMRYLHHANWKFFFENTLDALHPMVVHHSASRPAQILAGKEAATNRADARALGMIAPFASPYGFFDEMGQRGTRFGHGDLGNEASIHSGYKVDPQYWSAMVARYGEEKAASILAVSRNNSVLYPTMMFKAPVSLLRVIRPIAVDKTIIETWHFRLVGAPESLFEQTIQYSSIVNSSAGIVGPDDHEAYRRLQSGLGSDGPQWVMMSRYQDAEREDSEGAQATKGTSDFVHRNQFAAWRAYMEAAA